VSDSHALLAVRLLHTAVWAFFVACIAGIPVAAALRRLDWADAMTGAVLVECVVLGCNRGRCPLTDVAARYTSDRTANFDICLPEWLARHNKTIFGSLFAADLVVLGWLYAG
jgi:hypothetical protein